MMKLDLHGSSTGKDHAPDRQCRMIDLIGGITYADAAPMTHPNKPTMVSSI
jgi:hypothetical protein